MTSPRRVGVDKLRDPQVLIAVGLILVAVYALRHTIGTDTWLVLVVIIPSIILHELSHGVVAYACGDDTAKRAGRLSLNPIRHVDPLGTIVLPAVLALSGLGAFGWAKPVPVNPSRMRHPRNDHILVSLAGPVTNLLLAGLSVVLLRSVEPADTTHLLYVGFTYGGGFYNGVSVGARLLFLMGLLNVVLAVFNAIPIPPLDGSVVVERLLPASALPTWWQIRRYSMIVLLVIVLLDPGGIFGRIFAPAERAWAHLLVA